MAPTLVFILFACGIYFSIWYLLMTWLRVLMPSDSSISKKTGLINQLAFTCSKLTIETLEQGVKYVQN